MDSGDYKTARTALVNAKIELNELIDKRAASNTLNSNLRENKKKMDLKKRLKIKLNRRNHAKKEKSESPTRFEYHTSHNGQFHTTNEADLDKENDYDLINLDIGYATMASNKNRENFTSTQFIKGSGQSSLR